jgi:ABC-type phosphate/phosphonate transport system substrate-binding protein
MYDFPGTAAALDAVWRVMSIKLRREGVPAPPSLTRRRPLAKMWRDPALLFGQTCGYPYRRDLGDHVRVVATPIYAFEGCEGPRHRSFIVARRGDSRRDLGEFLGARAAINAFDSNTGMNLFRAAIAPLARGLRFFGQVQVTGSHALSLAAVADGVADVAAIDCISLALIRREDPLATERVKILACTPSSPGLPFISGAALPQDALATVRRCLFETLADPSLTSELATLGLEGAEVLASDAYLEVSRIEQDAIDLGYPELA